MPTLKHPHLPQARRKWSPGRRLRCAAFVPMLLASALAVAQPSGHRASGSSSVESGAATAAGTTPVPNPSAKPIRELEQAAQRLRDAIHVMAQAPAGDKRNAAIHQANKALLETQRAMTSLPPDLLTADADEASYRKAVDRLQSAAQDLRDATHALAREPASGRRNDSIRKIDRSLLETQQAMIDVPVPARSR